MSLLQPATERVRRGIALHKVGRDDLGIVAIFTLQSYASLFLQTSNWSFCRSFVRSIHHRLS
jgi:hypothetical protein